MVRVKQQQQHCRESVNQWRRLVASSLALFFVCLVGSRLFRPGGGRSAGERSAAVRRGGFPRLLFARSGRRQRCSGFLGWDGGSGACPLHSNRASPTSFLIRSASRRFYSRTRSRRFQFPPQQNVFLLFLESRSRGRLLVCVRVCPPSVRPCLGFYFSFAQATPRRPVHSRNPPLCLFSQVQFSW